MLEGKLMKRKYPLWLLVMAFLITAKSSGAQEPVKVARVGVLISGGNAATSRFRDIFRERLHQLGYVEGQNLVTEFRYGEGKSDRLPALAAELVRLNVDVIAAFGAPSIRAAKKATTTIPIVFETLADAVAMGFVSDLARPGRNVTGVTAFVSELGGKWLELLREVAPKAQRIALLSNAANPNTASVVSATTDAARALGLQLLDVEAKNANELDRAFTRLVGEGAAGVIVGPDALLNTELRRIAGLATKYRLPTISGMESIVAAGGLMFYGTTLSDNWRRAAVYVDKILKGAKPAELPVERPIKFELIVNLTTAEQIGLTMPPNLLARADRVIR